MTSGIHTGTRALTGGSGLPQLTEHERGLRVLTAFFRAAYPTAGEFSPKCRRRTSIDVRLRQKFRTGGAWTVRSMRRAFAERGGLGGALLGQRGAPRVRCAVF